MQQNPSTPTTGNTPAPTPVPRTAAPGAAEIFRAQRARREILGDQLRDLENKRNQLVQSIKEPRTVSPADLAGVEKRIGEIDQRIADIDKQIAVADLEVAKAAALPGATAEPPRIPRPGPPDEAYALGALFIVVTLLPLSIAFARRIWRRGAAVTVKLSNEMSERMAMLEKGMDAVAIEVERIGEGQRFVTQIIAEQGKALGSGPAEPIVAARREPVPVERESRG